MTFTGFTPTPQQEKVIQTILGTDCKYITTVSPRQAGKTLLAINMLLYFGINNAPAIIGFISPIYSQARKVMEEMYEAIKDSGIIESSNFSNFEIKLKTGSKIIFRSAEREDSLRGYTFDYLIIDESAYIREEAWKRAILPTTMVRGKKVMLFSTPRGRDWFYEMHQMGGDPEFPKHASCRMSYQGNPYVDMEEIEGAKKALPEAIFRAEYEGEFLEGESMVFKNFGDNTFKYGYPKPNGRVFIGLDLGRESDYTVAVAMDADGQVIDIYRENQKDWEYMVSEVLQMTRKYGATLMVETNSMGTVVYEQLKKQYQNTQPFATTNQSKRDIIESLVLAFNENTIKIPAAELAPELHHELEVFEMNYSPQTRTVRYAARPPFHDDLVMALAISNWCRLQNKTIGTYAIMGKR